MANHSARTWAARNEIAPMVITGHQRAGLGSRAKQRQNDVSATARLTENLDSFRARHFELDAVQHQKIERRVEEKADGKDLDVFEQKLRPA